MKYLFTLWISACLLSYARQAEAFNGQPGKEALEEFDNQGITATYQTPDCSNQNWTKNNDTLLWNEIYWLDKNFYKHDLCEQPVDLSIQLSDNCAGLQVSCLLFLDLDGNDTLETVLNSEEMGAAGLGWNQIRYNNLNTPNYAGGTLHAFDERPVVASQKFGFALEETPNGNGIIASLRFNTEAAPGTYFPLQLPLGKYKIVWTVSDSCGNNESYTYEFQVKDCQAPVVTCLNYTLSVNIMPTGMITLWASDFLQTTYDNCTPDGNIVIGVRKCGTGTGFPVDGTGQPVVSVIFTCPEIGVQCIELWAEDIAGNTARCEYNIEIGDNSGNCAGDPFFNIVGKIETPFFLDGIDEVTVNAAVTNPFLPQFNLHGLTDINGYYNLGNLPINSKATIIPEKIDNPLNGVTTYDLVLIAKHILGTQPFDSPYKMIAADANKSGSVTSFDLVELRKLILGIYNVLPNNQSWRFVDKSYVFPNPANPFQETFPASVDITTYAPYNSIADFIGIKVGDVNNSVSPNASEDASERSTIPAYFDLEDRILQAGESLELHFVALAPLEGFQFTLLLNGLKVVQVIESEQVGAENFNLTLENALAVSIDGAQEFTLKFKAEKAGRLSEMLRIGDGITRAEAYGENGLMEPVLRFDGNAVPPRQFELLQNRPNPFSTQTDISFYLPEASDISLSVFDATGRLVYRQETSFEAGMQQIRLDKHNFSLDAGQGYYVLQTDRETAVRKIAWF